MLMYSPLSAYFDVVIPQQPALINDGKQQQPALGDFISPIGDNEAHVRPSSKTSNTSHIARRKEEFKKLLEMRFFKQLALDNRQTF
jgi:hypothetical protein